MADRLGQLPQVFLRDQFKKEIRHQCLKGWQRRWERQEDGRFTFNTLPFVSMSRRGPKLDRQTEIKYNRLRSGHSLLAEHAFKMKLPSHPTPVCPCGQARETIEHYLLHCPNYNTLRVNLIASIERKYQTSCVPYHNRTFDVSTLLGRKKIIVCFRFQWTIFNRVGQSEKYFFFI